MERLKARGDLQKLAWIIETMSALVNKVIDKQLNQQVNE
jgi:hypothetical protein